MRDFSNVKNMIIKIGSSSLCNEKGKMDQEKILGFIQQIAILKRKGIQVTLVSSGAINAGVQSMHLRKRPTTMDKKQALAAIGQASLMQIYENLFSLFHLRCAQILLNHDDFDNRKRLLNLNNTMQAMMDYDVVPIVNENDTLSFDEIKVGDNDTLASLLVPIVDADLVVLVSDIDGLYNKNPREYEDASLIQEVNGITADIENMAGSEGTSMGTGGMYTKIRAAKICNEYGCDMGIINGTLKNGIVDFIEGKPIGTFFNGKAGRNLKAREVWIMYQSRAKGQIVVDDGCKRALHHHKSLLPKGIIGVQGDFFMSSVVDIVDQKNHLIGRGISNYSSSEIARIKGHDSKDIETILDYKDYDVVIHANNIVIEKEIKK